MEEEYGVYRDVLAAGVQALRPDTEVVTVGLGELEEEIARSDPPVVACSRPNTVDPGGRTAWIELSTDPSRPTKVCLGGRRSLRTDPTLNALIAVIDEAEVLSRDGRETCGC